MGARKINWKGPQPAPAYLAGLLRANFPTIKKTGIYNDRNVAGTTKKSSHAEGRALDFHLDATDPSQKALGDRLFDALIRKAESIGVDNVIWNRQIWSVRRKVAGVRKYTGKNAHTDHVHVEFTHDGSQYQTLDEILIEVGIIRTGYDDLKPVLDHFS
jgi:hypothetical protein